jgi:hypothetical protein
MHAYCISGADVTYTHTMTVLHLLSVMQHSSLPLVGRFIRLNCRWTASIAATAAFYGETEALEWLKSEGCTLDESVSEAAARGGTLDIL